MILVLVGAFALYQWAYPVFHPKHIRIYIMHDSRRIESYYVKMDDDQTVNISFQGKKHSYNVEPNRLYTLGRFNVPTAFYNYGTATPLDYMEAKVDVEFDPDDPNPDHIGSRDYHTIKETNLAEQIMRVFAKPVISTTQATVLMIIAVIIAVGIHYWGTDQTLQKICNQVGCDTGQK